MFNGIGEVEVEAECPDCSRFSFPLPEQGFVIRSVVRRFICGAADCPRRMFAEPFSRLTAPYARFTTRLNRARERVGLALAGRAGCRPSWASARGG